MKSVKSLPSTLTHSITDYFLHCSWQIKLYLASYSDRKHSTNQGIGWYTAQLFVSSNLCIRRRQWHPTPVLLPGKSHGWRSLVGCSPWGREESTERLHFHFSLSCIREGNGNPLQCFCLENPMDGGALWAAVYGVAQSRTWLMWLSSSSNLCISRTNLFLFLA